jgi:hypothetical protein
VRDEFKTPMSKQLVLVDKIKNNYRQLLKSLAAEGRPAPEIHIIRDATVSDWLHAIKSKEATAVIWIGHGSDAPFSESIANLFDRLPDAEGKDLLPAIKAISNSSTLLSQKFLGFITCHAQTILSRQQIMLNPKSSFLTNGKTIAQKATTTLFGQLAGHLNSLTDSQQDEIQNIDDNNQDEIQVDTIEINRGKAKLDWLVYLGGKPAGIWLKEEAKFSMKTFEGQKNLSITFEALSNSEFQKSSIANKEVFEEVSINQPIDPAKSWTLFANARTGKPFGVTQRTYNLAHK